MVHDFNENLAWSKGQMQDDDLITLKSMISGCERIETCNLEDDKNGNDYRAFLRKGAEILIDAKTRRQGCSKFWKNKEPELALEIWSVKGSKVGWTLCEKKQTDLILFKFDPLDCLDVFLVSYQLLRMAFRKKCWDWMDFYKSDFQQNRGFQSQAVFVPVSEVFKSIQNVSVGKLIISK